MTTSPDNYTDCNGEVWYKSLELRSWPVMWLGMLYCTLYCLWWFWSLQKILLPTHPGVTSLNLFAIILVPAQCIRLLRLRPAYLRSLLSLSFILRSHLASMIAVWPRLFGSIAMLPHSAKSNQLSTRCHLNRWIGIFWTVLHNVGVRWWLVHWHVMTFQFLSASWQQGWTELHEGKTAEGCNYRSGTNNWDYEPDPQDNCDLDNQTPHAKNSVHHYDVATSPFTINLEWMVEL